MSTQAMTSRRVSPPHPHHPSTNFTCEGTKGVKIAIVIGVIQTYDGYVELIYSYIYIYPPVIKSSNIAMEYPQL